MKAARKPRVVIPAILPVIIALTLPSAATAEDPGACFMVTSSGRTVNLGKLCGVSQPNSTQSTVFRVPIKRRSAKTPVIDVTFNGNQVFEMILDTGASGTLITQEMAKALKLKPSGTLNASIADGSQIEFKTSVIKTIAVNGLIANNIEVAIAPKADIGLLGHDFFENYDVKILEKQVEFHRR
ncbi:retropepsin-like aspartic protease [Calothrix sp. UHCC 0171]|uniref:retropepsin-like aspartic protease family protein n=1 Tax=Calothrix sp. UHCC 0171 TaxID=3110245 RepID=UPI002B20A784|nr:retropepsin-like aspartic protease [Calothrix sp. UHCC 0171]MEA5573284.1 retropepsin-like aspartic protease [Calothrix sp. UHCC 0171]